MNQSPFSNPAITPVQVNATLETIHNMLLSLWALSAEDTVAVDPWITKSAAQLAPEQRHFNQLLFAAFGNILLPTQEYATFSAYLEAQAAQPGDLLQKQVADTLQTLQDQSLRIEAEALASDPIALRQRIVHHLHTLWDDLLAAEWKRQTLTLVGMTSTINEMIFSQPRWQQMSAATVLRNLLQSEPTDAQLAQLGSVNRVRLVWSPHLLSYSTRFNSPDTLWVFRKLDPQLMRRDPLTRAEVLGPVTALADETRLRILELLTEKGELRAQEIIPQLESSQGNVSRHLKQLVGAGYVSERRADGANKVYVFNEAGLQRTIFRLRQLLSSHNAQSVAQQSQLETQLEQVRAAVSPALQKFLDEQGRITRWSSKLNDQQAMMEYLIEKFEVEKGYSEKEVNDLLRQWYLDADYVLLRRGMVDSGILRRTKDGARYWREGR